MDSVKKFEEIANGWKNYLFPSAAIESLARARANVCSACEHAVKSFWTQNMGDEIVQVQGLKCDKCNCPLSAATRSIKKECPLGKW